MGRELKRKQAKKEDKNKKEIKKVDEEISATKLIKILVIVILGLLLLYVITGLFFTKELDWFDKTTNTTKQTDNVANAILANSIFKQSEEEYFVYFYDFDNKISDIDNALVGKLYDYKIYKVNTKDALNKNYVSETTNPSAKTLSELKVQSPTLIRIVSGEITEYYETEDNIMSYIG